jgi:glycerol-3-phosphate dehydrogenase (NAD(P)+)
VRAVLITRAVAEAARLVTAAGGQGKTFAGLSGLGNLLVRASDRSADYQLGKRLAAGVVTADAGRTEGARAALAGSQLAKQLRARMPVLTGVAAVLAGKAEVREVATLIGDSVAVEE